jgi:hypothetical protein
MKNKIKFLNHKNYITYERLKKDYKIVESPLPQYHDLPIGEYLIRGDKKNHAKKYYYISKTWFLIDNIIKDNGHYLCRSTEYELFPNLSKKEWDKLNDPLIASKLTKNWQRNIFGYFFWMKLREIRRKICMNMYKHKKIKNEK